MSLWYTGCSQKFKLRCSFFQSMVWEKSLNLNWFQTSGLKLTKYCNGMWYPKLSKNIGSMGFGVFFFIIRWNMFISETTLRLQQESRCFFNVSCSHGFSQWMENPLLRNFYSGKTAKEKINLKQQLIFVKLGMWKIRVVIDYKKKL